MLNPKLAAFAANTAVDAVTKLLDRGRLCIFDQAQPETGGAPVTDQNCLATLQFGKVAFAPAADGVAEAYPIASDENAAATGRATWFRAFGKGGQAVFDGSVGKSGCNINLDDDVIQVGAKVSVSKLMYSQKRSQE
jgi:hypothetical protein